MTIPPSLVYHGEQQFFLAPIAGDLALATFLLVVPISRFGCARRDLDTRSDQLLVVDVDATIPSENNRMSAAANEFEEVVDAQLASLDASDAYASVWADCVAEAEAKGTRISWGGRGRGGRGAGRRTFQPHDVVVDGVCLEFLNDASVTGEGAGGSKTLLQGATIKLLSGKTYSLVGRNGVGKSRVC